MPDISHKYGDAPFFVMIGVWAIVMIIVTKLNSDRQQRRREADDDVIRAIRAAPPLECDLDGLPIYRGYRAPIAELDQAANADEDEYRGDTTHEPPEWARCAGIGNPWPRYPKPPNVVYIRRGELASMMAKTQSPATREPEEPGFP